MESESIGPICSVGFAGSTDDQFEKSIEFIQKMRMGLCENAKHLHDTIHGFIDVSKFAIKIIDSKTGFFQRLRRLKQLGACHFVYPDANHTRFSHSIGTYYLAGQLLNTIVSETDSLRINPYMSTIKELAEYYELVYKNESFPIDPYICELVKIAALCHDIGHGPFSHMYDDYFLKLNEQQNTSFLTHEERSCLILEKIVEADVDLKNLVTKDHLQFMKNLISPEKSNVGFIYQIVSNYKTGLDVDKFDYLCRDVYFVKFQASIDTTRLIKNVKIIDYDIVYPEQAIDDIYNLFQTRFRMHKQVYCHKVVVSIQFMILEIMKLLNDILDMSCVSDLDRFKDLSDGYICESVKTISSPKILALFSPAQQEKIQSARKIIHMIESREIYPTIISVVKSKSIDLSKYVDILPDKEDILINQNKIGYVSGNKPNPFDSIKVYKTKDDFGKKTIAYSKDKSEYSKFLSETYQETIIMIFYKDRTKNSRISFLTEYFSKILSEFK